MRTVAIVPMKLNNRRLPQKNTKRFTNGKPLCHYVLSTLLAVPNIDAVYVYCSDPSIRQYIPDGVRYLQRPASLDQDTTKMNEVLQSFATNVPADIYVMTHTTAPFINAASISAGLAAVQSGEYDSAFAVKKLQDFLWKDGAPFNYALDSIPRTQDLPPLFEETSGFYIYRSEVMTERGRRIGDKPYMVEVDEIESIDIDEANDFMIADAIFNYRRQQGVGTDTLLSQFRSTLAMGSCVYGPFMKSQDPMFVEAAGLAGFDFAILDMEHGPVQLESQQNNVRAAVLRGMVPIVRVKDMAENTIGSVLDIGAMGVQVPQVQNAEQARSVVRSARFYPYGMRGVCRYVRAANYTALDRNAFFAASRDLLVILQLEGTEAIRNLDEILNVEGIDILFVGPYDLSQTLGVPGEVSNPIVIKEMQKIVDKAKEKGKVVGTFVDDMQALRRWREAGIQYLSYNVDVGIFIDGCKNIVREAKDTDGGGVL